MNRRLALTLGAVVLLVAIVALADGVLRNRVEASIARQVSVELGAPDVEVTIGGFPFVGQIAGGSLDRVEVSAPSADLDGVRLEGLVATLRGVATGTPRTVEDLELAASLDLASLGEVLPAGMTIQASGDALLVALDALPIEATVLPRADGRSIALEVTALSLAGTSIRPGDLPFGLGDALVGLSISLDGMPAGLELTSVAVESGQLRVEAHGSGVVLPEAAAGAAPVGAAG